MMPLPVIGVSVAFGKVPPDRQIQRDYPGSTRHCALNPKQVDNKQANSNLCRCRSAQRQHPIRQQRRRGRSSGW